MQMKWRYRTEAHLVIVLGSLSSYLAVSILPLKLDWCPQDNNDFLLFSIPKELHYFSVSINSLLTHAKIHCKVHYIFSGFGCNGDNRHLSVPHAEQESVKQSQSHYNKQCMLAGTQWNIAHQHPGQNQVYLPETIVFCVTSTNKSAISITLWLVQAVLLLSVYVQIPCDMWKSSVHTSDMYVRLLCTPGWHFLLICLQVGVNSGQLCLEQLHSCIRSSCLKRHFFFCLCIGRPVWRIQLSTLISVASINSTSSFTFWPASWIHDWDLSQHQVLCWFWLFCFVA